MNGFSEPLLNCVVFVLVPESLHLISGPLRYKSLVLDLLPKRLLVQILGVVRTHYLKQLDSLNNCKLLFLADIQLFARLIVYFAEEIVIFLLYQLSSTDLHGVTFTLTDCISNPVANID